ncbi:MAG: hypothetical protein FJW38_19265 [Acidobacteria bacterium]|nr:hypothetical protein [Acidobacteriota bacterium]MBM3769164.1 hypothetical protein [Acidobacteriota bacterium]
MLEIRRGESVEQVLTFLTKEETSALSGLPPQAVVALIGEDGVTRPNGVFREFLHEAIEHFAPREMREVARETGAGRVVYIDDRAPEGEEVASEDIIGWFQVAGGAIVAGTYKPNPEHQLLTERGWSHAIGKFRAELVRELVRRSG